MGKIIQYNLIEEFNIGTEEEPIIERRKGSPVEIRCTAENLEANEAIAKAEAYKGEYTIEDSGRPETVLFSVQDDIDTMLVDHELRLTMLELDV